MYKYRVSPLGTINTLILFSLLVSAHALAQDNTFTLGARRASSATVVQTSSDNDCYKSDRNTRIGLRITDVSSLWHYATRILMPTRDVRAAPRHATEARKTEKGVVWRIGTANGGMLVSANLAW